MDSNSGDRRKSNQQKKAIVSKKDDQTEDKWILNRIGDFFRPKRQKKENQKIAIDGSIDRRIFAEDMRTKENMNARFHDSPKDEHKLKRVMSIDNFKQQNKGNDSKEKSNEKEWTDSETEEDKVPEEKDPKQKVPPFRSIDTLMKQMKTKFEPK